MTPKPLYPSAALSQSGPIAARTHTPSPYGYIAPPVPAAIMPSDDPRDPSLRARISNQEQQLIGAYYTHADTERRLPEARSLPPGLARKLSRGGRLPPGWEHTLRRGDTLPVNYVSQAHPLPRELRVQLPPQPPGVLTMEIEGRIVRLCQATREIIDILDP